MDFDGLSVSVYDKADGAWKQTWVDSDGNYLDFVGAFEDGVMDLRRTARKDGELKTYRMRWFDIHHERFAWEWQRSATTSTGRRCGRSRTRERLERRMRRSP